MTLGVLSVATDTRRVFKLLSLSAGVEQRGQPLLAPAYNKGSAMLWPIRFLSIALLFWGSVSSVANAYEWNPTPDKVDVLVISTHPDDEGIFMGSVLPYITQVRQVEALHLSMTSGDWLAANGAPDWRREQELRAADWVYGFRNEPLFARFRDAPTKTLDDTWDYWADGQLDGDDVAEGRAAATLYIAEQIRRYQPEVLVVSDLDGEYGHNNHRATSIAAADAYELAMNPTLDIDGLDAWQPKKYYIHQSEANGLGTTGYDFVNWLFHDYTEDVSIDTDGDGIPDATPHEIADLGLDEHVSQGQPDVSTVFRTGENYDGHHTEWWGLYRSTVGADTLQDFEIAGKSYTNWALGDFFEHVFDPSTFSADINQDGMIAGDGTGLWQNDDITAFVAGWGTRGHTTPLDKLMAGDINLDGRTNLADWYLLAESLNAAQGANLAEGLSLAALTSGSGTQVAEPGTMAILLLGTTLLLAKVPSHSQWGRSRTTGG